MTIKDLIETAKVDFSSKNVDNTQKNYSKESNNFLNVFESANKSYNFSFDKTEKFSYKNLNQNSENKNIRSKEFKSEYENFHNNNKIDNNKKINNLTREEAISDAKEAVAQTKEERKEATSEAKEAVAQTKEEKKEATSEAKEALAQTKEERKEAISDAKEALAENINLSNLIVQNNISKLNTNLDNEEQPQKILQNTEKTNAEIKLQLNSSEQNISEELTDIQKQIANEKITNKQAGNILQQQSAEVETEEEISEKPIEIAQNKDVKISDQSTKQVQNSKPEILASEEVLDTLNNIDKNQIKPSQTETLKPVTEKLSDIIKNEDSKPVITNIEVKNNSSNLDSDGQSKKQAQQEFKPTINQVQTITSDENNLQKLDLQKTSQFDKILNTKQTQNIENSVLNQLKDKISSDIATNKSQVTIVLRPDNLGKVNINLVSQNGILTAQITAENTQVKDILNKGLESLKQNMAEQGLNVGKMVVNVQESSTSNQNTNSEHNSKDFQNANSNASNMNYQSGKQNSSENSSSAYLNNELYDMDEEIENEINESNALAEQSNGLRSGTVDYKV